MTIFRLCFAFLWLVSACFAVTMAFVGGVSACFVVTMTAVYTASGYSRLCRSDFLRFVSWLAGWVASLLVFGCLVLCVYNDRC